MAPNITLIEILNSEIIPYDGKAEERKSNETENFKNKEIQQLPGCLTSNKKSTGQSLPSFLTQSTYEGSNNEVALVNE